MLGTSVAERTYRETRYRNAHVASVAADIREPFAHTSASLSPVRTADASPLYLSGRTQLTIFVRCASHCHY